ncbi:hypothetical protein AB0C29_05040 [Actinoplanes sp. NPDC048791]|uniref:hypothetical protein n=1 Tax=Actinoplanes sp. NPDC048791 TaxID=3154623 RepID=UPI003407F954
MNDCQAAVPVECDSCDGPAAGQVYETIIDGRLHWVLTHECGDSFVEAMGWDETPDDLRQALLDQCGTYRLRLSREITGVAVMRVLRASGMSLAAVPEALAALTGPGRPGTEMELQLLAGRLRAAGASATVERDRDATDG